MEMDIDMNDAPFEDAQDFTPSAEPQYGEPSPSGLAHDALSDSTTKVLNKVYISGLDTLTTQDIKTFVSDHYSSSVVDRVEWVDDTGANLVFATEAIAHDALISLSVVHIEDASQIPPGESVDAKPYALKPEVSLRVRYSLESDKKVRGAAQRSRFYLLHPEHDPETRRRYRDRDNRDRRYNRDDQDRRGGNYNPNTFDASYYDDPEYDSSAGRNDDDRRYDRSRGDRSRRDSRDYRPRRGSPRSESSRPRSASRDRRRRNEGRELFTGSTNKDKELFPTGRTRRGRSASPLRDKDDNSSMEEGQSSTSRQSRNKTRFRAMKDRISHESKELFPRKTELGKRSQLDQADEAAEMASQQGSGAPDDMHIKGIGDPAGSITIKGRAAKTAKELFPDRFGADNTGKELFVDRLDGRGGQRRKAEDLFL